VLRLLSMAENVAPSDIQRFEPARYLSSGSSFRCFAFALIFLVSSISVYTDNTIVQPRLGDQKNAHKAASLKRNATAALIRSGDTLAYYKGFITRNQAIAALPWASSVDHLVFHEPDLPSSHINHLRVNSGNLSLSFVDVGKTFKSAKRRDAAARRKLVGRPGGKALKGECEPTDLSEQYPLGYKAMCWFWYSQVLSYTHAYDFVLRVDDDCFLHPNSPWPRGNTAPVSSFVSSNAAKYRRPAPLPPPPSSFTLLKLGSTTLASTPLGIAAKQAAKSWVQHVSKGHSLRHSLRGGDDARSTKQLVESETTTVDTPTTRNATITSSSSHSSSSTERNSASASISSASSNISNISSASRGKSEDKSASRGKSEDKSASRGKSEGDLGGGRGWRRARSRKSHSSRRSSSSSSSRRMRDSGGSKGKGGVGVSQGGGSRAGEVEGKSFAELAAHQLKRWALGGGGQWTVGGGGEEESSGGSTLLPGVSAAVDIPMDNPNVTVGMRKLFRSIGDDLGNPTRFPFEWAHPYTNVFLYNAKLLRSDPRLELVFSEVRRSGCIWLNRWGDMPLWGATREVLGWPLGELEGMRYFHGTHGKVVEPGMEWS